MRLCSLLTGNAVCADCKCIVCGLYLTVTVSTNHGEPIPQPCEVRAMEYCAIETGNFDVGFDIDSSPPFLVTDNNESG